MGPVQGKLSRLRVTAAAAVVLVVVAAATLIYINQKNDGDPVASSDVELNIFRSVDWNRGPDESSIDFVDFRHGFETGQITTENIALALQLAQWGTLDSEASPETTDPGLWEKEFGIDPQKFTAAIRWGYPPEYTWIFSGNFTAADIEAAVQNNSDWSELLETAEHRGVTYYSWGDDFAPYDRPSVFGPFAHRVALVDGLFITTRSTEALTTTIDRILDGNTSTEEAHQLGEALSELRRAGQWSASLSINVETGEFAPYPVVAVAPINLWEDRVGRTEIIVAAESRETATAIVQRLELVVEDLTETIPPEEEYPWKVTLSSNDRLAISTIDFGHVTEMQERSILLTNLLEPIISAESSD